MGQELEGNGQTGAPSLATASPQTGGVPVDDDRGEQVEACHAVVLSLRAAVPDLPLATDAQGVLQGMMGLPLVETDLCAPLHGWVQGPVDHEQGALDAADLGIR